MTEVLADDEWLEAARQSLGLAKDADLRLIEVSGKVSSGDGDVQGFIGETLPVRVSLAAGASGERRRAALFLKVVPEGNALRERFAVETRAFSKESGFFDLVARLSARLPATALPPWGPRCFRSRPRLLLFDDLGAEGFRTLGIRHTLDFAHSAAALEAVARLHAMSLAVEEGDRYRRHINPWQLGDRFPEPLQEILFTEDVSNLFTTYFAVSLKTMKTVISLMPEHKDSPRLSSILRKVDQLPKLAYEVVKRSDKYRNVICHGDLWVNNIMFKTSSWGQVEEARLVDFQLTRYAPPALDVEMLLQLCLRRELRDARGAELRAAYYDALERALGAYGLRARDLVPRADFEASCRWGRVFGRIVTATYFPGHLLPTEMVRDLFASSDGLEHFVTEDRSEYVRRAWAEDAEYRDRVGEVMRELVDNLLLAEKGAF